MPDSNYHIEKEIVIRLKESDSLAFNDIYNLYSRKIYRFAYSFLKTKQDSEEIVQEVFIRVWENRKKIDEFCSFKAFLFTISYNVIIDKFRERLKYKKYRDFLKKNSISFNNITDEMVEYSDLNKLYKNTVALLPKRRRIIYKMHRIKGLSYEEIAKKMNISTKTVENQMGSALKYLRKKLKSEILLIMLYFLVQFYF